jgi:hypothetical protein
MEERPTLVVVKRLIEASDLELGERLASALLPVCALLRPGVI